MSELTIYPDGTFDILEFEDTESQNSQVLAHLKAGKGLSQMTAIKLFKCYRLSGRIKNLRDRGNEIYAKMVEHNHKRFAVYYMEGSNHFNEWGKSYVYGNR